MAVLTEKQIKYGTVLERPELYEKEGLRYKS